MVRILLLFNICISIIACQSAQTNNAISSDSTTKTSASVDTIKRDSSMVLTVTTTLAGQWYLMAVLSSDTAAGKIPEINFNLSTSSFTGNTGCNRMSGKFQKTDSSIVFDKNIMTTKMACTGYNEDAFMKNLLRINRYRFDSNMLILLADGVEVSKWTRKPDRGPKTQKA